MKLTKKQLDLLISALEDLQRVRIYISQELPKRLKELDG